MNSKKQFRNILIVIILFLSALSCTNPIEIATETMHQNIDSVLSDDINFLIASTSFMCYNANENYWYTDDFTYREMIDDKYKHGLKGLAKLQKRVGYIESYALTQDVFDASVNLKNEIIKENKRRNACHATIRFYVWRYGRFWHNA